MQWVDWSVGKMAAYSAEQWGDYWAVMRVQIKRVCYSVEQKVMILVAYLAPLKADLLDLEQVER